MKSFTLLLSAPALLSTVIANTGSPFYGAPPDDQHPWAVHDRNRPQPPRVEPGTFSSQEQPGKPPSDAIVLFDGTEASLAKWASDKNINEPTKWIIRDGALECVPKGGYIRTKEEWGDCQLHVEWAAPSAVKSNSQGRGNSGVFLMGIAEIQVLDNFDNPTYADGFSSSVYGVNPPAVNPLEAPGKWQVYDIIFRRPIYKDEKEVEAGYFTVFLNGVLTQDHTPLEGGGGHMGRTKARPFPEKGPLKLQDHGNPVRYRNIWYRPLPPRSAEGGTNGILTPEATKAKRKEIAQSVRDKAAQATGNEKIIILLESLCYEADPATIKAADELATSYLDALKQVPADQIESKKGEVRHFARAYDYLAKCKALPNDHPLKVAFDNVVKERRWEK